ncbi:MAG TPA: hypothetical protein VFH44_04830 [Solirubrobacterales bacterium]|nr:hypothetical protein [Solirubrobacterales bacterium]
MKSRMILSTIVLVVALALAPAAFAGNSSVGTYGGQGGEVAGSVTGGDPADPGSEAANSSALPFTGLDLELLAGGGLLLLLGGFGMARMAARREDAV